MMRKQGKTASEIALALNISVNTIRSYIRRHPIAEHDHKCKNCGNEIVPTYLQALSAMHCGTTRYLKCPKCGKRTWCKKVFKK